MKSFYPGHYISIPVQKKNIRPDDFALEIGSGHNPKARSDVLCDVAVDDNTQRGGSIVTDRPFVEADGQYLPFVDSSFDYVICSHVLEHVENPARLISELVRVAPRGYIETPSEIAERLFGWSYHRQMINLIDGQLMISRKVTKDRFEKLFHLLLACDKNFSRFYRAYPSLFLVRYEWEGKIDFHILPPDTSPLDLASVQTLESLLEQVEHISLKEKWKSKMIDAIPKKIVFKMKSFIAKRHPRTKRTLKAIVVCPVCKGEVEWETDLIRCGQCNANYPIIRNIPRLTPLRKEYEV